jgi:O-antigen/teichoic acid export membrane protein
MSLLRKAALVNTSAFICLGLGVLQASVLARVLGPEGIGQYAVILSALVLGGQIFSLGIPLSFLYHSQHDPENTKSYRMNAIWSMLLLGIAGGITVPLLVYLKPGYFGEVQWFVLLAISAYVPVVLQRVVARNHFLIRIEARRMSLISITACAGCVSLILILAWLGVLGVGQALICFLFAVVIRAGLGWYWMWEEVDWFVKPSWKISRKLGLMGIRQSWSTLMILVNNQINMLIIRYLLDDFESVGFFNRGQRVAMLTVTAGHAILPLLFSRWAAFPEEKLAVHVEKVMRFASTVAMIMIFAVLLTGRWIILVLYTSEFLPAFIPMVILVPGTMLYLLSSALVRLLGSRGAPELAALMLFCGAAVNASLSWMFIPVYGINGAAVAATAGYIVLLVSLVTTVKVKYGIRVMKCLILNKNDIKSIVKTLSIRRAENV